MVSGPLPLAIWRSTFRTGDGFLVGEGDFFLALVGERRLVATGTPLERILLMKTDDYDAAVQIKHMPEVERG